MTVASILRDSASRDKKTKHSKPARTELIYILSTVSESSLRRPDCNGTVLLQQIQHLLPSSQMAATVVLRKMNVDELEDVKM